MPHCWYAAYLMFSVTKSVRYMMICLAELKTDQTSIFEKIITGKEDTWYCAGKDVGLNVRRLALRLWNKILLFVNVLIYSLENNDTWCSICVKCCMSYKMSWFALDVYSRDTSWHQVELSNNIVYERAYVSLLSQRLLFQLVTKMLMCVTI